MRLALFLFVLDEASDLEQNVEHINLIISMQDLMLPCADPDPRSFSLQLHLT